MDSGACGRSGVPKSRRGGKRIGAGRKKNGEISPTAVVGVDFASAMAALPPDEIEGVAKRHARSAIDALVKQVTFGTSEAAKVAAANALLDRGYGKPTVEAGGDAMLPFLGVGTAAPTIGSEIRDEARKYAYLAIEVLKRIAKAKSVTAISRNFFWTMTGDVMIAIDLLR